MEDEASSKMKYQLDYIGRVLSDKARAYGRSATTLAGMCGSSVGRVTSILNGRRDFRLDALEDICVRSLQISPVLDVMTELDKALGNTVTEAELLAWSRPSAIEERMKQEGMLYPTLARLQISDSKFFHFCAPSKTSQFSTLYTLSSLGVSLSSLLACYLAIRGSSGPYQLSR